ncbi:MAG: sigma-70 family RNA polymerase sigma factor [Deltaproteobacteria bacterium]|nr:sigma-70 family RNA polymerase sigma factor [Deltaproteobacteria bacterium]
MAERDDDAGRTEDDSAEDGGGGDELRDEDSGVPSRPAAGKSVNTGVQASSKPASPRSGDDARETDLELVRRCQKGDSKAFEDLLGRYRRKVYGLAMGMVANRDDAMDVMQDAFVRVFRHIHSFQGDSSFYTWLYRITMNLCIDHVRKSARTRAAPFEDRLAHENVDQGDFPILPVRHDVNPGKAARRHELMRKLSAAMEALPEHHRAVIVMREFEGLSYEEMAQVMQVPKGTIMSRLFHARHKLQKALAEYLDGEISVA